MSTRRIVNMGQLMSSCEQDVSAGDRSWPEVVELEASNYPGWVVILDAEMKPVALVSEAYADVMCEVMNRFKADTPEDCDDGNPMRPALPDPEV